MELPSFNSEYRDVMVHVIPVFKISKSDRSDRHKILFLGIITIQILQVMVISGD